MKQPDSKCHATKRRFDSFSDDSDGHSSDYSPNTDSKSDYSRDYSREKHGRREARADGKRISNKFATQERFATEGFRSRSDGRYDAGKNKTPDENVDNVGKGKHFDFPGKADRDGHSERKQNGKVRILVCIEPMKWKERDKLKGLLVVGQKEERSKERDNSGYGNLWCWNAEDHRREDNTSLSKRDKQNEYSSEGRKHGRRSHNEDEKQYDASKRETEDEKSNADSKRQR